MVLFCLAALAGAYITGRRLRARRLRDAHTIAALTADARSTERTLRRQRDAFAGQLTATRRQLAVTEWERDLAESVAVAWMVRAAEWSTRPTATVAVDSEAVVADAMAGIDAALQRITEGTS